MIHLVIWSKLSFATEAMKNLLWLLPHKKILLDRQHLNGASINYDRNGPLKQDSNVQDSENSITANLIKADFNPLFLFPFFTQQPNSASPVLLPRPWRSRRGDLHRLRAQVRRPSLFSTSAQICFYFKCLIWTTIIIIIIWIAATYPCILLIAVLQKLLKATQLPQQRPLRWSGRPCCWASRRDRFNVSSPWVLGFAETARRYAE